MWVWRLSWSIFCKNMRHFWIQLPSNNFKTILFIKIFQAFGQRAHVGSHQDKSEDQDVDITIYSIFGCISTLATSHPSMWACLPLQNCGCTSFSQLQLHAGMGGDTNSVRDGWVPLTHTHPAPQPRCAHLKQIIRSKLLSCASFLEPISPGLTTPWLDGKIAVHVHPWN